MKVKDSLTILSGFFSFIQYVKLDDVTTHSMPKVPTNFKEQINHLILSFVEEQPNPITVRPVLYESPDYLFDWNLISSEVKVEVSLTLERRESVLSLHSILFVVWIFRADDVGVLLKEIRENVNRRIDSVLLLGPPAILESIILEELFMGLKSKMGVAISGSTGNKLESTSAPVKLSLYLEPRIFTGRLEKVETQSVVWSKKKFAAAMGANLRGRHFKVCGCEFPPWLFKVEDKSTGKVTLAGNHYNLVEAASQKFNFTFESLVYSGPLYGQLLPNGTWTGMYANLYYHDRGFAFSFFLGHDTTWSKWVDYPSTFGTADLIFATSFPMSFRKWNAIIKPFKTEVWLWLLLTFIVISATLFLTLVVQSKVKRFYWQRYFTQNAVNSLCIPFIILIEQGVPDSIGKRIKFLTGLCLLLQIIVGTGYKSTLKSNLTFSLAEPVPQNYQQLSETEDYKVTLNAQGVVEQTFFQKSTSPKIKKIRGRLKYDSSTESCVTQAFINPKSVCIGWSPYIQNIVASTLTLDTRMEPLIFAKDSGYRTTMSMGFQKHSIFVDSFSPITGALYDTGIFLKWEEKVNYFFKEMGKQKMLKNSTGEVYYKLLHLDKGEYNIKPLTFNNLSVIFYFLAIGAFIALISFFFEYNKHCCSTMVKDHV